MKIPKQDEEKYLFLRYSSMNIDCHICHTRYHMDHALFKGSKGVRVRCRKCGNFLDVFNPVGIASDRIVENDTSFSRDPSDNRGIEPAVSPAGQGQSPAPEMKSTLPVGEPACLSQENGEEEEAWEEIFRKPLPVSADAHAPPMFSLPFLKSPGKARWSSLVVLVFFLLLFIGGSAYLFFTPVGKGMLSGIGRDLADTVLHFRS
jgi:predicted Zn finger-like uncharacterized protein